ncbi:hypothetical protein [Mycolicibacterium llatzerense]|uniref:hypothetical protein n=1 Tax=Mycolicibacterium llatzerense TaxID=280871 RepID=UPI0021B5D457|nr:hypothetical protein [Mycolicibacterium llatzerense]
MNQTPTATMQFSITTTRAGLAHWWTDVEHAVAAAAHRAFASPTPVPAARTVHLSYLEHACMAREMDRL